MHNFKILYFSFRAVFPFSFFSRSDPFKAREAGGCTLQRALRVHAGVDCAPPRFTRLHKQKMATAELLKKLDGLVGDEGQAVTYKWASRHFNISSNLAKQ